MTLSPADDSLTTIDMRIEAQRKLFVGVKIDNKMREQLERCPQRDRIFFEAEDHRYLTVMRDDETSYVGKIIEPGTATSSLEDLRRNVLSILNRICPGRRDDSDVKMYALGEAEPVVQPKFSEPEYDRGRGYY